MHGNAICPQCCTARRAFRKRRWRSAQPGRKWPGCQDRRRMSCSRPPFHQCVERYLTIHRHRSEEHTSELQSLMRISYAVFCLKKKKLKKTMHTNTKLIKH